MEREHDYSTSAFDPSPSSEFTEPFKLKFRKSFQATQSLQKASPDSIAFSMRKEIPLFDKWLKSMLDIRSFASSTMALKSA
mmetsp:Transcript_27257/g.32209  ORF Transcript_27257/g.32209 Transcript_27257/m.32209 type:complete len:81 (-) Transcript_27257:558-800(-)